MSDEIWVDKIKQGMLLGFEELMRQMPKSGSYPPYNIEKKGNNQWIVAIAIAGFKLSDLKIELQGRQLIISGQQEKQDDREYIYKGIAERSFVKSFLIAEEIKVEKASLDNGILEISLVKPFQTKDSVTIPIQTPVNLIDK